MTIDEEFHKFTHQVEEVLQDVKHEVEEVFHKAHMILSVRDFSMQIAFVLMGITTAILIIGTVYVRCFHHPKRRHDDQPHEETENTGEMDVTDKKTDNSVSEKKLGEKSEKIPVKKSEKIKISEKNVEENAVKSLESESEKPEQNGQVRKRTTSSSSASVNNNNSPVKSKIPVFRQKSVTKSP